jgi:4-hydroxy 2-oxovalerate aldolase
MQRKGTWLTYREDVRVVDCTIRDGGLINNFHFNDDLVKAVYDALEAAGVDYMEVGYKAAKDMFKVNDFGKAKFCDENFLRDIIGDREKKVKISVMADVGRTNYKEDILKREDSVIDMIRVAAYIHQIPAAIDIIKDAKDKGYEATINLMSVSTVKEHELDEALEVLGKTDVDIIYLVDSFGSLYSEDVEKLMKKYIAIAEANNKKIGVHCHNNQQLAYANTLEAMMMGASYLDATLSGMGRGAGNCPLELLMGFLKNPKYNLRPIVKCLDEQIAPLRSKMKWGPDLQYQLTGQFNVHPRPAIEHVESEDANKSYLDFYDKFVNENL